MAQVWRGLALHRCNIIGIMSILMSHSYILIARPWSILAPHRYKLIF